MKDTKVSFEWSLLQTLNYAEIQVDSLIVFCKETRQIFRKFLMVSGTVLLCDLGHHMSVCTSTFHVWNAFGWVPWLKTSRSGRINRFMCYNFPETVVSGSPIFMQNNSKLKKQQQHYWLKLLLYQHNHST